MRKRFTKRLALYRPIESEGELARLESRLAGSRNSLQLAIRLLAAFSALLLALNLATSGGLEDAAPAKHWWSLIPILLLWGVVAVGAARAHLTLPRALEAQRQLLVQQSLAGLDPEIQLVEERISAGLDRVAGGNREGHEALLAARRDSRRLLSRLAGSSAGQGASGDSMTAERLRTVLATYRVALANLDLEALLQADLYGSPEAATALEAARRLLNPETTPSRAEEPARKAAGPSLAVLPFTFPGLDADQEYFGYGLAEEIIDALSRVEGLRVIARSSAFKLAGEDRDAAEIGHRLGVGAVLEGSVRRSGDRLQVTVRLARSGDGRILWSEGYDRRMVDIFAIQDEITATVVKQVKGELLGARSTPLVRPHTSDLEAYHLYLRGRHACAKRSPADLKASLGYYRQAIARDEGFALAHAGLADSLILLGYYSLVAPREAFPPAEQAARRAIDLAAGLAEAHLSLASIRVLFHWDWAGAEEEFERAFKLKPGYATAYHWFAEYLAFRGRHDEAIDQARHALTLDPLSLILNVLRGWTLYYARRYDEAIEALLETLQLDPDFAPAELWLGLSYEQKGRRQEALEAFDRAITRSGRNPLMLAARGRLHAELGDQGRARNILDELESIAATRYVPAYHLAAIHSGGGNTETALDLLEVAFRQRENWMVFLDIDPIWDRFRNHERFRELLARVGLTPPPGSGATGETQDARDG